MLVSADGFIRAAGCLMPIVTVAAALAVIKKQFIIKLVLNMKELVKTIKIKRKGKEITQ
jgi:TusA-related sulfurtransferase